jgi:hypothetical protein
MFEPWLPAKSQCHRVIRCSNLSPFGLRWSAGWRYRSTKNGTITRTPGQRSLCRSG